MFPHLGLFLDGGVCAVPPGRDVGFRVLPATLFLACYLMRDAQVCLVHSV